MVTANQPRSKTEGDASKVVRNLSGDRRALMLKSYQVNVISLDSQLEARVESQA